MLRKTIAVISVILISKAGTAQILGGGTNFSNAVLFNQSWLADCPATGTTFSNEVTFEPTITMDTCAPAPSCVTGPASSDVWFKFFAQATTATIVVNPNASLNIAIQAFSGSECPGLTEIGCTNAGGNNVTETLNLSGLTVGQLYYFRVFAFSNNVASKSVYTFCGSSKLGGGLILSADITNFNTVKQNNTVLLNWTTGAEVNNAYFEIERSNNGNDFEALGRVAGSGTISRPTPYSFTDLTPVIPAINYYRLKTVSNNGNYKYSPVAIVRMDVKRQKSIIVLSNPVIDKLSVKISSDIAGSMQLKIIDNSGQVNFKQNSTVIKGDNILMLAGSHLRNLSKGIYTIQATINNEVCSTRFMSVK